MATDSEREGGGGNEKCVISETVWYVFDKWREGGKKVESVLLFPFLFIVKRNAGMLQTYKAAW